MKGAIRGGVDLPGVRACAMSPDGTLLVSANSDGLLTAWWTGTGEELRRFEGHGRVVRTLEGHRGPILGCAVSPGGSLIVSAGADETVIASDGATGDPRMTLVGHTGSVRACAVGGDGSFPRLSEFGWHAQDRVGACLVARALALRAPDLLGDPDAGVS